MKKPDEYLRVAKELMRLGDDAETMLEAITYRCMAAAIAWTADIPASKLSGDLADGVAEVANFSRVAERKYRHRNN